MESFGSMINPIGPFGPLFWERDDRPQRQPGPVRAIAALILAAIVLFGIVAIARALPSGRGSQVAGVELDGQRVTCDVPSELWMENRGADPYPHSGMCVMTSIEMAALLQGLDQMRGLRDWCAREPGGGYPAKVDDQIKRFCKAKGMPVPPYIQYEGPDPEPVLALADRTGRMACTTCGYSPRYVSIRNPSGAIYHMVCSTRHRAGLAALMDNNAIGGVDRNHLHEWMAEEEQVRRVMFTHRDANGTKAGWVFVWLAPPPPPPLKT